MDLSKSIDFLLENGGDVIRYRLHKEILKDISKREEAALLEKVMQTPYYRLIESYVRPNGYIGYGMHSWENFGSFHKETPLQDGEYAARLLSNYAIPKDTPIVKNFVTALRDDKILETEFSYINPEVVRFRNRYIAYGCGFALMELVNTSQALLGYGDDEEMQPYLEIAYRAFESVLHIRSLEEIGLKRNNKWVYVEPNILFPCQYHLEALAHTQSWRSEEKIATFVKAVNYHDKIMRDGDAFYIKIGNRFYAPYWAYREPFKPFEVNCTRIAGQRKTLTHLAMIGGDKIDVVKKSMEVVEEALSKDGILRLNFVSAYQKRRYKAVNLKYPGPYSEIALETEHETDTKLWCELTFWAVQLLNIVKNNGKK